MKPAIAAAMFTLICAALTPGAHAQINLPAVRLPQLPTQLPTQLPGAGANELPVLQGDAPSLRRRAAQHPIQSNRQIARGRSERSADRACTAGGAGSPH